MRAERHALEARKVGNFARTLAKALLDESPEELERFVREDRRLAREGLVPLMDEEGEIRYKHIDELLPADAAGRIRADTAVCDWLVWRTEQRSEWLEAWRRRSG